MSVTMGKEASLEGLEFDGDTVLCRVCGDKASGFHYGVHACEGCKGFFRRSIQQKIQYRPCLKNQQCNIMRVNRNRCQYCRLKKCIAVGMSRDAVRFGRVPKKEKARIIEQMQKSNLQMATTAMSSVLVSTQDLVQSVLLAHKQTCNLGQEKSKLMRDIALLQNDFVDCPAHMACPLNSNAGNESTDNQDFTDFSEFFGPAIKSVVDFAKLIPGFMLLSSDDQITLLKAATFEVLLVRMACLFDSKSNTMMFANGRLFKRQQHELSSSVGFLLDSMFDFAERFNELRLTDDEVALFSAVVLLSPDRPGVRQVDQVEKIQAKLTDSLQNMINANHKQDSTLFAKLLMKTTDLRTLNALHAEKTVAAPTDDNSNTDMHDSQGDSRSEDSPSDSSSVTTHTSSASGMDMSQYDSNGSLNHFSTTSQRFPCTDSPQGQVVLKTPYGTFYREDTGYYGLIPEQPRRRCHTLDRDSQISRPRLHTIEEGTKRRFTMDREYINKMVTKLSDRLEKRSGMNSMPVSCTSSAASSPVPILEEQMAFLNGNRDFIPISTPDSSTCSSRRTSPAFLKDTLQPFASSPNSPRPRSGSFGTGEDIGPMRPRCSSFHMNSEGHAAQGRPYSNEYEYSSPESQHYRMAAEMRRGSVGASYNLHARKKSLLVDRHPGYLNQLPEMMFRKTDLQRSPLAQEDQKKLQQIGGSESAFEHVQQMSLGVPHDAWNQSLLKRELQEPPIVSVTAPVDEPQTDPPCTPALIPGRNSGQQEPVLPPSHDMMQSPECDNKGEDVYHKKFDKLRKHLSMGHPSSAANTQQQQQQYQPSHQQQQQQQHQSQTSQQMMLGSSSTLSSSVAAVATMSEESQHARQMENLSIADEEKMDTDYGDESAKLEVVKEEKPKSAGEAHPQLLAQLQTGPQFSPVLRPAFHTPAFPQQPQNSTTLHQYELNKTQERDTTHMINKQPYGQPGVALTVPQGLHPSRSSPTLGSNRINCTKFSQNSPAFSSLNSLSQSFMSAESHTSSAVSYLKDKLLRKYPAVEAALDAPLNGHNIQNGASVAQQFVATSNNMVGSHLGFMMAGTHPQHQAGPGMYSPMFIKQDGMVPNFNQHLAGMQQLAYGNQEGARVMGETPLNLSQGPVCTQSSELSCQKIKEEVIS